MLSSQVIAIKHHRREETMGVPKQGSLEIFSFKNDMENTFPGLLTVPKSEGSSKQIVTGQPHFVPPLPPPERSRYNSEACLLQRKDRLLTTCWPGLPGSVTVPAPTALGPRSSANSEAE